MGPAQMQYAEQFIDAVCPDVFEDKEKIKNGIFRLFDLGVVYALTICVRCLIEDLLQYVLGVSPLGENSILEVTAKVEWLRTTPS